MRAPDANWILAADDRQLAYPVAASRLSVAGFQSSGARTRKVFKTGALRAALSSTEGRLYGAGCKVLKTRELHCSLTPLSRILCNFSLVSCCWERLYFFIFSVRVSL